VVELRWTWIRDVHWSTSTYENDLGAYEQITDFLLTGSGSDIVGHGSFTITGDDILKYMIKQLFHPKAVHGARVYALSFAFEPDHKIDRSGSLNFGNTNAPTATLTFPALASINGSQLSTVFWDAVVANIIQVKGGDMVKLVSIYSFNPSSDQDLQMSIECLFSNKTILLSNTMSLAGVSDFVIITLGLVKPWQRFTAGWLATSTAVWLLQPNSMFQQGIPRSWKPLAGDKEIVAPTSVPWYAPGVIPGLALAMFI